MSTQKRKLDPKPLLALIIVLGVFALTVTLIGSGEIPASVRDILLILVGSLVTIAKDVYGYYFGSSEGSARKTELLTTAPAPPPAPEEVQP